MTAIEGGSDDRGEGRGGESDKEDVNENGGSRSDENGNERED